MKCTSKFSVMALLLVLGASCGKKITGPAPSVGGLTPSAVCQAQIDSSVEMTGEGLSPLYTGALADGQLELPSVQVARVTDLAGAAAAGAPVPIPDNPRAMTGDVRWTSQNAMSFTIRPALALQPGLYDITVANANGKRTTFPSGLLAVPPPVISGMTMGLKSDVLCGDKQNTLTLSGDFFIKSATAAPVVQFTDMAGVVKELPGVPVDSSCRVLPGQSGLQACTAMTVDLVAGVLADGQHKVVVKNPAPVGCSSTTDAAGAASPVVTLTIVPEPTVTLLAPEALCAADDAVSVVLTGTGFLTIDGVNPLVALADGLTVPAVASNCVPVAGPTEVVATCTTLTVTIPKATVGGSYEVRVTNPAPADCVSALPNKIVTLFDRPVVDKVEPPSICSLTADAAVVLTGSNFATYDGQIPSVKIGDKTFVPTVAGCTMVVGPAKATQTCTRLTVNIKPTEFAAGNFPVVVTNPAPIGCANNASAMASLEITTPPTLTGVSPSTVCAGSAVLTLTGTNFSSTATVKLGTAVARKVTVNAGGTQAVAEFAGGLTAGGPYDVSIENGVGCGATRAQVVTVVEGPQIFFADPEIVYNGLNVQATVYGTGFSGAVQSVALKKDGAADVALVFAAVVNRSNQVQVTIPKDTAPGTYAIELRDTTTCPAQLPNAIVVTDQKTLQLAQPPLTPAFGWKDANTAITLQAANVAGNEFKPLPRIYLNPVNPGAGTVATALGAVAFVATRELTALVPGGLPAGKYDVIVVNPDGKVGVAEAGFEITTLQPPAITTLSPGSVANSNPQVFTIVGRDFRTPTVTLSCVDGAGNPIATNPAATVSASTATSATVSFNASVAGVACVVRLTNGDDKTFADFSALVITNPAQNLNPAKSGKDLLTGRRAPVALGGDASPSARFFHVIGGDDGAGVATDGVETASLDLLGIPGDFVAQPNRLLQARAFAGGARLGRYLYVAGGSNGATLLDTVERAAVLDPATRGAVTDLNFLVTDAGLGAGLRYYRVAAVMKADDAFNPGGENLASDPFPVRVPDLGNKKLHITVVWAAVPGAEKYRVYRSPNAGDPVGSVQLIGEVDASVFSFTDSGMAPIAAAGPLPVGATGKWHAMPTLSAKREGAGVAIALDPADPAKAYLYVLGGRRDANTALDTFEYLPIALNPDGSQTAAAAFIAGTNMVSSARWQLGLTAANNQLSSRIPVGETYLYAVGGATAAGTAGKDAEAALVQAGGQLGAFVKVAGNAGTGSSVAGAPTIAAGDFVFAFGGQGGSPSSKIVGGEMCGGTANCSGGNNVAPYVGNFNAGQDMLVARYLSGGSLSGAFIYVAGGVGAGNALLKSVEYRIW